MYTCQYARYLSKKKHKNFGQLGAIKLEQIERLLSVLKSHWSGDKTEDIIISGVGFLEYEL